MKKLVGQLFVTAAAAGIGPHTLSWGDSLATVYFMLRRAGTWLRIDPAPDYRGDGQQR